MSEQLSAEELRRLMDVIRHRMTGEVAKVADNARQLADWRFYLHEFTGPVLAATALAGFLVVPKKSKPVADLPTLETLAQEKGWVVDREKAAGIERPGLVSAAAAMAGSLLLKAGLNYAAQNVGRILGQHMSETVPQESTS